MNLSFFNKKSEFLILTFLNLIIQAIITRYTMVKSTKEHKKNKWFNLGLFIFQLVLIFALCMPIPIVFKFLLFCLFSVTWGFTLSALNLNDTLVHVAFYGTLSVFGIMAAIGVLISLVGINLGPQIGLSLFYGLLCLLLFGIFNIIAGDTMHKIFSMVAVILFSMYIIYDTNKIMQRDYKGDFIQASLDYYLDIVNIFLNLFSLQD
jgi:FtsH-binding integral membrane protein